MERANLSILRYLRTSIANPKDWDLLLRDLQYTVNKQINTTSGFTLNDLIFDFQLRDVVQNQLIAAIHDDVKQPTDAVDMTDRRKQAADHIRLERERWKRRFDQRHSIPTTFLEGDLVVIENDHAATGESRKL